MSNREKAVRDAAAALHDAIVAARKDGLHITWPSRPEDLPAIAVSEAKKPAVTVQVDTSAVDPEVAAKAGAAAQKAAERTVEKAKG